jgi:hypothetical protein
MAGRLNSFQKSMVQWNQLHPYNAVHVAELRGALDLERLQRAVNTTLTRRGLGRLEIDDERGTFHYFDGAAELPVSLVAVEGDPRTALATEIERQLNRHFPTSEPFCPFRVFAVPTARSCWLGLVYFHPVADAESVVLLLKEMAATYAGRECLGAAPERYPHHRTLRLRRHAGGIVRKLIALPGQLSRLSRSHRVPGGDAIDAANGFALFTLAPEQLRTLVSAAKAWDLTVNDLLLARLLKSLAPFTTARLGSRKRRELTVGCIVNLRRELGVDSDRTFGLFLGSFNVTHAVPEGVPLRKLALAVREQTAAIKQRRLFVATPIELGLARALMKFFSADRRRKLYAKHYPLWGGVTNMNLNALWNPAADPLLGDYVRGVSTGPMTPLVLSVSTVGNHANIGVSWRKSVFSDEALAQWRQTFDQQWKELD